MSKTTIKPLDGSAPFQVDSEDAQAYAMQVDSDGAPMYAVESVDGVVLNKDGTPVRTQVNSDALRHYGTAGKSVYTDQGSKNLAADYDKRRGEVEATKGFEAGLAALGRIPGVSNIIEDAVAGEDLHSFRQTLKSERPYMGAAGDVGRTLATMGALGLYSAGAGLIGYAGNAGRLAQVATGVGLGIVGGATEAATLEALHSLDNNKGLAGSAILNAAGHGALWGGITAGAIPAAGAVARAGRGLAKTVAKRGPVGSIARKVFGKAEDAGALKNAQREAYEKTLKKQQAEIGTFTPEKFKRMSDTQRREIMENVRGYGATAEIAYDDARLAAERMRGVETARKRMDREWQDLSVKTSDRFGGEEWRKTFEHTVEDVEGVAKTKWGWTDEGWSIAQEELRMRIDQLSQGGYGPQAEMLEELLSKAHKGAPGVVAGRLHKLHMQANLDVLAGKEGASAAREAIRGLLGDTGMWGKRAAVINDRVADAVDDAMDAIKNIRAARLPDKFDRLPTGTEQVYQTIPVMAKQLDDALAVLRKEKLLDVKATDRMRNNLTKDIRAYTDGVEGAKTARLMQESREEALALNAQNLGKNAAPAIGSETVVAMGKSVARTLASMDEAASYIGKAIEGKKFQNKFKKARTGVYAVRDLDDEGRKELYEELEEIVGKYGTNPYERTEQIGNIAGRIAVADAGIADHLAGQMNEQIDYITSQMPETPAGAYGKRLPPADSEIDSILEVIGAINDWPSVVASVSDGTVTPEATHAMRNLAPALFARARTDIAQVIEAMDPFDVPDELAAGLNIFMGELDPVYSPEFVMRLQDTSAQTSAEAQLQGQGAQPQNVVNQVPQHQNPQTGITPGVRLGSY